jgi:transposase
VEAGRQKLHILAVNEHVAAALQLSGGGCYDAPQGRKLLESQGLIDTNISLLMDRAYEGDITRDCALKLGYSLCVPPKSNRKEPWGYDRNLYKRRNEVERLFAVSKLIAKSLLVTTNSMLFFLLLFSLLLLLKLCDSVNTP